VEKRYKKAQDIMQTHIFQKSPRQINLSHSALKLMVKEWKECTISNCPPDIFDKSLIHMEILVPLATGWLSIFTTSLDFTITLAEYIFHGNNISDLCEKLPTNVKPLQEFLTNSLESEISSLHDAFRAEKHN
jgi:hypothetical protein